MSHLPRLVAGGASAPIQVGARVEVNTNALAFVRQGALVHVGLPVVMGLPEQNRSRPGEIVDLWVGR